LGIGVELDGLVDKKLYKETKYNDPVAIATKIVNILKKEAGCDLIVCLSHLGYKYKSDKISDLKLAAQTDNIDLIIGGHTHTFLDKPTSIRNLSNKETLITQVGLEGINLGRLDFYVQTDKNYSVSFQNLTIESKSF